MSFLPQDYKIPAGPSNYMAPLPQGPSKFRVVGDAVTGYVYWTEGEGDEKKTVHRLKKLSDVPVNRRFGDDKAKHFWAFPVYNYAIEMVQILEIMQVTIQTAIEAFTSNPDWGDPKDYDITITKKGEGWDTEYVVTPSPKKALTKEIENLVAATPVKMEALFSNEDPFEPEKIEIEDLNLDDVLDKK